VDAYDVVRGSENIMLWRVTLFSSYVSSVH